MDTVVEEPEKAAEVAVDVRFLTLSPSGAQTATVRSSSQILRSRSQFFEAQLSHRNCNRTSTYSGDHEAAVVDVNVVYNFSAAADTYVRCIKLMAVPPAALLCALCRSLRGVDDALEMLRVAQCLLFADCVDACLEYLEMLPSWTDAEEASIRAALDSLQLLLSTEGKYPDLMARLVRPQARIHVSAEFTITFRRRVLIRVLSVARKASNASLINTIDPLQPIPESEILDAWNANLNLVKEDLSRRKSSDSSKDVLSAALALSWMLSQLLTLKVADCVVGAFSMDKKLALLLTACANQLTPSWQSDQIPRAPLSSPFICNSSGSSREANCKKGDLFEEMLFLLTSVADSLCRGRVLLKQKPRICFIETWLPLVKVIYPSGYSHLDSLFKELIDGLPHTDREQLSEDMAKQGHRGFSDLDSALSGWCGSLWQSSFWDADEAELSPLQLTCKEAGAAAAADGAEPSPLPPTWKEAPAAAPP